MKLNMKLRSAINKHAHAKGLELEIGLRKTLLEKACELQKEGNSPELIAKQLGLLDSYCLIWL